MPVQADQLSQPGADIPQGVVQGQVHLLADAGFQPAAQHRIATDLKGPQRRRQPLDPP